MRSTDRKLTCVLMVVLMMLVYHRLLVSAPAPALMHAAGVARGGGENDYTRYESTETWRTPDSFEPAHIPSPNRPKLPAMSNFRSKGEYLKQPLIADFPPGAENIFLMIKTGGSEMWNKLPMHFLTTLTKFPHFALYSDAAGSVAGYEVVDILQNVSVKTQTTLREFKTTYQTQKWIHDDHGIYDHSENRINYGWDLDRFKNVPMLKHAYNVAPAHTKWFVFIDADSYLFAENMIAFLDRYDSTKPWYLGSAVPGEPLYFVHGGSGVAISRNALDQTIGEYPDVDSDMEELTAASCCGDMIVGSMMLSLANITASSGYNLDRPNMEQWDRANMPNIRETSFQGNSIWDVQVTKHNWCMPLVSFHHVTPHDMERLYEYERLTLPGKRANITYGDIHTDFYAPYISHTRPRWDNNARDVVFSLERDKKSGYPADSQNRPYDSEELCFKTCEYFPECLAWRWLPHDKYCGLNFAVRLGHPAHRAFRFEYDHDEGKMRNNTDAVSGWMMDRIDEIRHKGC